MGILDTQNLNDGLLANFESLDHQRAPFGKRGQYNVGENPSSNQYFGGFTYASDDTTREAFGTDAASTRIGPIGDALDQGDDFKYGTEGQARLSTSQSTVLTQAASMTAGEDTEFGSEGSAGAIARSWTSSDELRSLRNTQTGSGQETSGYDANNTYGISNWDEANEGTVEVYRPQATVATGLRNIDGIRGAAPQGSAQGPGDWAEA